MTGKSTDNPLLQRIREWWKPENNMVGKRVRENSFEYNSKKNVKPAIKVERGLNIPCAE